MLRTFQMPLVYTGYVNIWTFSGFGSICDSTKKVRVDSYLYCFEWGFGCVLSSFAIILMRKKEMGEFL